MGENLVDRVGLLDDACVCGMWEMLFMGKRLLKLVDSGGFTRNNCRRAVGYWEG